MKPHVTDLDGRSEADLDLDVDLHDDDRLIGRILSRREVLALFGVADGALLTLEWLPDRGAAELADGGRQATRLER
jgi:hypothetical protein